MCHLFIVTSGSKWSRRSSVSGENRPVRGFACVVIGLVALVLPGGAAAGAEEDLANRYAPVLRLVAQDEPCGPGEPYRPLDIDALLGQDTVALRGPWRRDDLVEIGPKAEDLAKGLYDYHLDFPGNALEPGCDYERWANRTFEKTEPTAYAHISTDPDYPGKLALQYWFFYAFNDYNNKHEGDWEMIQLNFDAATPEAALEGRPVAVGYSQHEGAERAAWGDDKLELVGGTHPVVHPAAGSHANYFDEALFLGRSAEQGVGCDDTSSPTFDVRPVVRTIPTGTVAAEKAFPWIAYEGRWGERQKAFYNGPTGPNLKGQWTAPISWSEDSWRDRSYAIPAGGSFGTNATDFFCGAVAGGSDVVRRLADNPTLIIVAFALLAALLIYAVARTTWRPTAPLRVARRRSWGQVLSAAARMYVSRPVLFIGIGLALIPITLVIAFLQSGLLRASAILGVDPDGEGGGFRVAVAVWVGSVLALLGLTLVQAATARALAEIDAGREVGPVSAYRLSFDSALPLLVALAIAVTVVTLLSLSVFLIPIAIWLTVQWALLAPALELEEHSPVAALGRSRALVRRQWLKVASLVVVSAGVALVVGPLTGAVLIFLTHVPFEVLNVVAGVVYAVAMPFVALTTTYVYYDTFVRDQIARARKELDAELPAETPG
jgi:hypothetical protein